MQQKKEIILILFVIIIFQIMPVHSMHESGSFSITGDPLTTSYDAQNPQNFDWQHGNLNTVSSDQLDFAKIQEFNREAELTKEQLSFKDSSGNPNINKVKDWNKLDKNAKDGALSEITKKPIVTEGITNGKVVGNGVEFDAIQFWKIDKTSINNCIKCSYDGIKLKFQHADSVLTDKSASTNIGNFDGYEDIFSVEKADSLITSGITVSSIENTEFAIGIDYILMKAKKGTTLHIMGIGYIESDFEAFSNDSEIRASKDKSEYEIKNGRLNYSSPEYTDSIETNSTAKIEIDEYGFGFKCMLLGIKSTYWYNDKKDLRKDFGINVPDYGIEYRLCIKRLKNIEYKEFDGLIDFIDKRMFLSKVVNYLRYPLKNNQIASLLSSFVYKGLKDVNTIFSYDNELIFLNSIFLTNKNKINGNLSIAYPSNYYTIKEMKIDGEVHSIIQLNLIKKEDVAQNINYEYKTDYFVPKAVIKDNVLVQDNGKNKIIIFPPEHEKISERLK